MPHRLRVSRSVDGLEPSAQGAVTSVGVFDGVHLGHQSILEANVARAGLLGAEPTVVTFAQHPKAVLLGRAPRTLTTLEHKLALLWRAGIRHAVVLTFNEELRDTTADDFSERILERGLGTRGFVLGFDSKFGKDRLGGPASLEARGHDVEMAPKVMLGQRAVSSTVIRESVELGDLAGASRMLGRPVTIYGEVVMGEALGRRLGFPTANLDLLHELRPPEGVYACRAHVVPPPSEGGAPDPRERVGSFDAVANIGRRPTVATEGAGPLVEVHLLDFEGDLYGQRIELEFAERLRAEVKFGSLDELQAAITADVERARAVLSRG
ncbi:riboflavin biosynthesis protein RibF [bacterium]|nr:riboflavin biosynthesis protein RibF [Planctomycetota bacterium]MDB4489490.1 riboflavin biosynthesis protein RibF [bacterium]MDB4724734.1 riboflavin biosynthesis protein RibF [Planctomycetota bacterium]